MVHAVNIIDNGGFDKAINVYRDAVNAKAINVGTIRQVLSPGQRNDAPTVAKAATDALQMLVDDRLLLSAMDPTDPDRLTDPAHPWYFHGRIVSADQIGQGGNAIDVYRPIALVGGVATHLIGREFLVTVTWDGTNANLQTETPPTVFR